MILENRSKAEIDEAKCSQLDSSGVKMSLRAEEWGQKNHGWGAGFRPSNRMSWLDEVRAGEHFLPMSTLVEIESAVANLPQQEQWSLLEWLQSRLPAKREVQVNSMEDRKQWLAELAELRARGATGKTGSSIQEIMDDIREDRC